MAWSRSPPLQGHRAEVQGGKQGRLRCRDASGSQEAPLGEAQGGDMVAKQWQNLQLEWPSILASLKLETGNNWKQLGNA